ncbi:hypothetical protein V2G26_012669 [Clonostachys chloroleuca]
MRYISVQDQQDRGPVIIHTTWVLVALAIAITLLRVALRFKTSPRLSTHDYLMTLAMLLLVGSQAALTQAYYWGLGVHDEYIVADPTMPWIDMLKWIRISTVPGVACSIIARVSVCFFLVNIFGTKVWLKWWLIGNTILVAILGIVSLALAWCQSDPVEGLWNTLLPAKRMDPNILLVFTYVSGGIFAQTDLTFVLFPIITIWKLNMALRRKIGLCFLMAGSLFGMVSCIMRILTFRTATFSQSAEGVLWNSIEQSLVVILGSMPLLPAIQKLQIGFLSNISSSLFSLLPSKDSSAKQGYPNSSGSKSMGFKANSQEEMIRLDSREV